MALAPAEKLPTGQTEQPSVSYTAPVLVVILPAGQLVAVQFVAYPPAENVPGLHVEQPSIFVVAPSNTRVAICPGGHTILEQEVAEDPEDYFPVGNSVQPSLFVPAPLKVEILPAGNDMFKHEATLPPVEYLPAE